MSIEFGPMLYAILFIVGILAAVVWMIRNVKGGLLGGSGDGWGSIAVAAAAAAMIVWVLKNRPDLVEALWKH